LANSIEPERRNALQIIGKTVSSPLGRGT